MNSAQLQERVRIFLRTVTRKPLLCLGFYEIVRSGAVMKREVEMRGCRYNFQTRAVGIVFIIVSLVLVRCGCGLPLPAPKLPEYCNSEERCCMPRPYVGKPVRQFEFSASLPLRIRRPAHLLDEAYIAKLERGVQLQRDLPDTDPRSFFNQQKLHCLYCDNGIYYPNQSWPLEIHGGWHFLPWHRMFVYFNERIIAKLLRDDAFALPFWNWDNQTPEKPYANTVPYFYARNKSSPLWNPNRNNCTEPPYTIDLNTGGGCTWKSPEQLRIENTRMMYTQVVSGAPTTNLFFGMPYRFGDAGTSGSGSFEDAPHGTVHFWMGDPNPTKPAGPYDDMGNFAVAARDPIFYGHHANVDRVWTIWKSLGGQQRTDPTHPDFLNSQYTFYDENGDLVVVNASQTLNGTLLRYEYEEMPTGWTTNGQPPGAENNISKCSNLDTSQLNAVIGVTQYPSPDDIVYTTPYTFRLTRPSRSASPPNATHYGTEVLELAGVKLDPTTEAHWRAYLFHPSAVAETPVGCPEFLGIFNYSPHVGMAIFNRNRVWRVALGSKLAALGKESFTDVIITIAQFGPRLQPVQFANISIVLDVSPSS